MTYTILIYRTTPPSEEGSAEDERAALAGHRALQEVAARRGELHAVARLDAPSQGRTVRWTEAGHDIADGPYIETKEWLVGFYLVDCASEDEAVARASPLCRDGSHAFEVRPVTWRWRG